MADVHDPATRSRNMGKIGAKDTKIELILRSELFAKGFRYRLHRRDLPGTPDLVFPKYNAVVHVNGCFWHGHECASFRWPSTDPETWRRKIEGNIDRDSRNNKHLSDMGWRVMTVWGCALTGRCSLSPGVAAQLVADWLLSEKVVGNIEGKS